MRLIIKTLGLLLLVQLTACEDWPGDGGQDDTIIGDTTTPWRISVKLESKWGAVDEAGKYILNPIYDTPPLYRSEVFTVEENGKTKYLDADGNPLDIPHLTNGGLFSEGLAPGVPEGSDKVGYFNKDGDLIIQPKYDKGYPFFNGAAAVEIDGKMGFISEIGKWLVHPELDLDQFPLLFDDLSPVKMDGKWGYMDQSGELVINPQFEKAMPFSEGLAAVRVDGNWGYINETGKIELTPHYDWCGEFFDGHAVADEKGPKPKGLINKEGEWVLPPQYAELGSKIGGVCYFLKDGEFGYLAPEGSTVIRPKFSFAGSFISDNAVVASEGRYGLIDKRGKFATNPQFSSVDEFAASHGNGWKYLLHLSQGKYSAVYGYSSPTGVAEAFLKALAVGDYAEAKLNATEESFESLDMLEKMGGGETGGQPEDIQEVTLVKQSGDRATVSYLEKEVEKTIDMVKENGVWKARFSKGGPTNDDYYYY